jgi:hypothetical protein
MNNYLVPVDKNFIEDVAKAIARERLQRDATTTLESTIGYIPNASKTMEQTIDRVFETIWAGNTPADNAQKDAYRMDAIAAINLINLKLVSK